MTKSLAAAAIFVSLALCANGARAQVGADLNISPKRVAFKDGERSATVYVFNQGDKPATYTIDLVDRAMMADGQIVAASEHPEAHIVSAEGLLQYTPRRITLQPKQSQSIRVRLTPEAATAPAELRTHLTVTAVPSEDTGFTVDQAVNANGGAVGLKVVALFSVSIPIIVREGAVDARAAIENVKLTPADQNAPGGGVSLDLVRLGLNSVYGDVEIYSGEGRLSKLVGAVRGVAVYPEIPRRTLNVPFGYRVTKGEPLRIVYRDDDTRPGAELATVSLAAP